MKKYLLYILFTICSICSVHAEFKLVHKLGAYSELQENGMQKTHTDYQIMYAREGETVYLYRPDRGTFIGYVRWYCYDTDSVIPDTYSEDDAPLNSNGNPITTRIESTWPNDNGNFKKNAYGWFACEYASDRVTTSDKSYIELKYTMHKGDSVYRIACDEGIYKDYSPIWANWNDNATATEATLSKRIIYEIRPAKWIADSLENYYKVSPENPNNDNYLEEHEIIAPINRQLYIGPNYMYRGSGTKIKLKQYHYYCRSNYHYYNSQGNIAITSQDSCWKWYKNGVEDTTITLQNNSSQFVPVYSSTPGTVIYTLKYNSSPGYFFNIAKFKVTYKDVNEVGPVEQLPPINHNIDKIYEETFNFDKPNTSKFRFWKDHFDVDESTYGYYNINLDSLRKIRRGQITWSEYAVTNTKEMWVDGGSEKYYLYQHKDSTKNNTDGPNNAKEGYMLYCDGSQQPGLVFNLKVNTNLCPGSTMYFSAWIADASSKKDKTNNIERSAPNMDFQVIGIDELGNEHALTTFTTGEFGVNAAADRSRGEWEPNKVNQMDRGIWYQILFPIKFTSETTYPVYRLRITNKSTSSDGNDFAIDDIRIYVQKPPVIPIQASTSDCIDKAVDTIRTYLRIDYQEIDYDGQPLYYQWRENNNIIHTPYHNIDGPNDTYGKITILSDNDITENDTCFDLFSFDNQFKNTDSTVVRYILEEVGPDTSRYVMYIAMPMQVRINHEYTGFVSLSPNTLGDRTGCGTFADILIAGGTRITINDEISFGDSVVTVCGHRTYTLNIVLTKIIQDETQGELRIDTTHCRADWLIGDSAYVNAHPDIYKYSFKKIESYLKFYHQEYVDPEAIKMVNFLKQHNLLILDTASIIMNPGISLSYTAFPIYGSARDGRSVCTTPRFLHIQPADSASNMMEVGNESEILPEDVLRQPRIVRISNAKKKTGFFSIPMYLIGDKDKIYEIEKVELISSTFENWYTLLLTPNHTIMNLKDTVILTGGDDFKNLEPGYDYTFHIEFKGENDEDKCDRGYTYFTLRIIPDVVTWQGGQWNLDVNWDYFIPMKETNVLLLNNTDYAVSFNDMSLAKYDINYTENQCNNIYFPDGASMYGQELIDINGKAFIDIKEYAWKWTLTSIPIKGVVSGDFFISVNESSEPFVVAPINQTVGSKATDRTTWLVYRKEFDKKTQKWKSATNSLTTEIEEGITNMIGIDSESDSINPIIRLPKSDSMYYYYDKKSWIWLNENEHISRNEEYGKPIWNGDTIMLLKQIYDSIYLFGNPTFGYINISKLVDDNSELFTGEYYFEPFGAISIPKKDQIITYNRNVKTDEYEILLPPYRGILLKGKQESNSLLINIDSTYINSRGRVPMRRKYNNDNIPTNINNVFDKEVSMIYDIMGRYVGLDLNKLPNGIYIIRKGKNTYKMFIEK